MTGPGEPTDREVAMAAQLERLARQLTDLATLVAGHETVVANLAEAVAVLTRPGTGGPASWLWPVDRGPNGEVLPGPGRMHPDQAAARMDDLCEWLARVYLRYHDVVLPTCWAWHPDVVEELLWLRGAHAEAYTGRGASWKAAGDWHERYRPGVVKRIRQAAGTCELAQHRDGGAIPQVPLAAHVGVVAAAWAHRAGLPDPTASVVAAADRHDRQGRA